jgi:hypothetical protein
MPRDAPSPFHRHWIFPQRNKPPVKITDGLLDQRI